MAKCIFENLTPGQAHAIADWFNAQGEQDFSLWAFSTGTVRVTTDIERKGGCLEATLDGDVIVYCKNTKGD